MQTYADFEKQQQAVLRQMEKRDTECISCPKCSSQWFEEVQVSKYKADHNLVLGQHVPPKPGSIPYILLRCLLCNDALEPKVISNTRDIAGGDYENFLDTMEGKLDKRKEEKKAEPKSNEIQAQKL